jgi:hypothetical protein
MYEPMSVFQLSSINAAFVPRVRDLERMAHVLDASARNAG